MKNDIELVRDEWQMLLSEKELELKKLEASESLRLKNLKSDLNLQFQAKSKEQETEHNEVVARLECEKEELRAHFESRLTHVIEISEHERILNSELTKASGEATEKLEQIEATMENLMHKTLQERLEECQRHNELVLLRSQQTMDEERALQLDQQAERHAKELRDAIHFHKLTVAEVQEKYEVRVKELQHTNELFKGKLEALQMEQRVRENAVREMQVELKTESLERASVTARLESSLQEREREVERVQRRLHQLQTKHELLKNKLQDIATNMTAQVAYTIDELRDELAAARAGMTEMADEHQSSMEDVKRIFVRVNRKLAESLDKATQERDQYEDQVDQLKQRLRKSEDRLQRVIREKRENIDVLKSDFAQVLEIAKQEVQRKYGLELKQLKRCVIQLKHKLIEEIDSKQRTLTQVQQSHEHERTQLENELQRQ